MPALCDSELVAWPSVVLDQHVSSSLNLSCKCFADMIFLLCLHLVTSRLPSLGNLLLSILFFCQR